MRLDCSRAVQQPLAADIWQHILDAELGHVSDEPEWFTRPAVTQRTISTPRLHHLLGGGRSSDSRLRPYSFCDHAIIHADEPAARERGRFDLVAPYERDPARLAAVKWADAESGGRHQISTSSFGRGEAIRVKRIRDIVTLYRSGVDGAFGVRLAVAPDGRASDRELRWAVVTSEPYLLVVSGGLVCISGLEWVGSPESAPIRATLPHGRYAVRCTLVAWDEEAAAHGLDGPPGEDALPDFLVVVEPAEAEVGFRTDTATFDPPDV